MLLFLLCCNVVGLFGGVVVLTEIVSVTDSRRRLLLDRLGFLACGGAKALPTGGGCAVAGISRGWTGCLPLGAEELGAARADKKTNTVPRPLHLLLDNCAPRRGWPNCPIKKTAISLGGIEFLDGPFFAAFLYRQPLFNKDNICCRKNTKTMPVVSQHAAGSGDAPSQYNQRSRKGKKAWRKNVDVTEVQEGLEELNNELIRGYVFSIFFCLRLL